MNEHAGHSTAMFRTRFWIVLLLTIPTAVCGLRAHAPVHHGLAPAVSTVVVAVNAQLLRRAKL